ncbi:MAG: UDP-glucuronic acid decarboxylase family protein [Candidatus Omnitrophota bacterium]
MKILLTGGAGFIGSHLTERLLKEKHDIICVDNFLTGSIENVSGIKDNKAFVFINQDISEGIFVEEKIDFVLHFASPASPVDYFKYPIETLKVGSMGTYHALELARKNNSKFLFSSTSEVYGDPKLNPQPETYWGNVNPIGIRSVYDEAKRFSEAMISAYRRKYSMDTKIVRIFNTYGERMRLEDGRVVPNLIKQALLQEPLTVYGDGTQTRSFCYVSDLIEGIIRCMGSEIEGPVNLGNPVEISILDFAKRIKQITGTKSDIVFKDLPLDDPKVRKPDIFLAQEKLNWNPQVALDEGLTKTISWFKPKLKAV